MDSGDIYGVEEIDRQLVQTLGEYRLIYESDVITKVACIKNLKINRKDILYIPEEDCKDIGLEIDDTIRETDKLKMVINMT